MAELIDCLYILWSLRTIVETLYTVNVHHCAFVTCGHHRLTTYGRSKTVTYKDRILDAVLIQYFINGMGKEVERVFHVRLIALSVARQVDEYESQVLIITKSRELLLPSIHVTAEAVNEADGFCIRTSRLMPYFIMYAYTIVDSNIL